ncbi:MAG: LCP family protein [Erysipelotrichaceae bacterium]|nr:LCP family protein [Erysipelotrichaceae bacterium]
MTEEELEQQIKQMERAEFEADTRFVIRVTWFFMTLAAVIFFIIFVTFGVFPLLWCLGAGFFLFILILYSLKRSFRRRPGTFPGVLNILLTVFLIVCSVYLPVLNGRIHGLFSQSQKTVIGFYALKEDYRAGHGYTPLPSYEIKDLQEEIFLTQNDVTPEVVQQGIEAMRKETGLGETETLELSSLEKAVNALYSDRGQVLVLNEAYVPLIAESEAFADFNDAAQLIYSVSVEAEPITGGTADMDRNSFSVYLAGSDTRSGLLSTAGRFDVNMLINVNPQTKRVLIVSIPRDLYVPNPWLGQEKDKLTHLGIYGIDNTMNELEALFGTEIDNYMIVNFNSFKKIVDSLGGIEVDNPYAFEATEAGIPTGYYFEEGMLTLNGDEALAFVRERYTLPDGDFGRNMHQTLVLNAILDKMMSSAVLVKADRLLRELQGSFLTNVAVKEMYGLIRMQLGSSASWQIDTVRLSGEVGTAYCASGESNLSVVFPDYDTITDVAAEIAALKAGEPADK